MAGNDLVSRADIQEMAGVKTWTVNNWARMESFPKPVGDRLWRRSEIERWLATKRPRRNPPDTTKDARLVARIRELYTETQSVLGTAKQLGISKMTVYKYAADLIPKREVPKQFR